MTVIPQLAGVWIWESFGKEIVKYTAKQLWAGFNWLVAAQKYRDNLYQQYAEIQIFGQPEPVPLEGIFTHVYTVDKPTALQRFDIDALRGVVRQDPTQFHAVTKRLGYEKVERIDGLALVTQPGNDRLFILGKPGAGKTTFLKYLTLQAVQGKIDKIPIFVSLRAWADSSLNLLPFIVRQFEICDFPDAQPFIEHILRQGHCPRPLRQPRRGQPRGPRAYALDSHPR